MVSHLEPLVPSEVCSCGQEWKFSGNQDSSYCHLHCTDQLDEVFPPDDEEDEAEERAPVHKLQLQEVLAESWFLSYYLPSSVMPAKYLRALY